MSVTFEVNAVTQKSDRDVPEVALAYPRVNGSAKSIEVALTDVRAADSIRVTYDFERDGWSILQASVFEWDCTDEVMDADWQEVAFVQAWGRQRVPPPEEAP
jgi:hypothetical protein